MTALAGPGGPVHGRQGAQAVPAAIAGQPASEVAADSRPGSWRLLVDDGVREPRSNLALDEALARCADGQPTLRLWRNERCVVVGRLQLVEAEVDGGACRDLDVPVFRRFTGGGAVYHDPGNLNVSAIAARDDPRVLRLPGAGLLPGLFGLVLLPLAEAVRRLGPAAAPGDRGLWIGERKVGGVAAWIGARTVLVHATLLVDADLTMLERVLAGPGAPGDPRWERTRSRRAPVTSLAREGVVPRPDRDAVDAAVIAAFGADPRFASVPSQAERETAAALLDRRYAQPAWHALGREPEGR